MKAQDSTPHRHRRTLTTTVLISLLTLCVVGIASRAQDSAISNREEREFKSTIPEHVPVKVKVTKPEKVKDLQNEEWLADLEVEVTNTGMKPIYFLSLSLHLPEVKGDTEGSIIGYQLRYGRIELVNLDSSLQPGDVPLLPGGSVLLKVPESSAGGWKLFKVRKKISDPKKISLRLQMLNHGDGTGFRGSAGTPLPDYKKLSSTSPCGEASRESLLGRATINAPPNNSSRFFFQSTSLQQPAKNSPAVLLPARWAQPPLLSSPTLDVCCPSTENDCFHNRDAFVTCQCGERIIAQSAPCSDERAGCFTTKLVQETCLDFTGTVELSCDRFEAEHPCDSQTPTPTPTPECDEEERPNNTNCLCADFQGAGTKMWDCRCPNGFIPADHRDPANLGCPPDTFNHNDCCIPYASCAGMYGSQEAYELARQNCLDTQGGEQWRPYPDCDCGPPLSMPFSVDTALGRHIFS